MHDLSSNVSREVARTALDNKAPSALAFLYINNPVLLSMLHLELCSIAYASRYTDNPVLLSMLSFGLGPCQVAYAFLYFNNPVLLSVLTLDFAVLDAPFCIAVPLCQKVAIVILDLSCPVLIILCQ